MAVILTDEILSRIEAQAQGKDPDLPGKHLASPLDVQVLVEEVRRLRGEEAARQQDRAKEGEGEKRAEDRPSPVQYRVPEWASFFADQIRRGITESLHHPKRKKPSPEDMKNLRLAWPEIARQEAEKTLLPNGLREIPAREDRSPSEQIAREMAETFGLPPDDPVLLAAERELASVHWTPETCSLLVPMRQLVLRFRELLVEAEKKDTLLGDLRDQLQSATDRADRAAEKEHFASQNVVFLTEMLRRKERWLQAESQTVLQLRKELDEKTREGEDLRAEKAKIEATASQNLASKWQGLLDSQAREIHRLKKEIGEVRQHNTYLSDVVAARNEELIGLRNSEAELSQRLGNLRMTGREVG